MLASEKYIIEYDIRPPVQKRNHKQPNELRDVFKRMLKRASVFVGDVEYKILMRQCQRTFGEANFCVRKCKIGNINGFRVWRLH